jgi:hypothetical protein
LNSVAATVQVCSDTIQNIQGNNMIGLLRQCSIAGLQKVNDEITFKGGQTPMHLKNTAEILMPCFQMLDETEKQLKLVRTLVLKKFERQYTDEFLADGTYNNSTFKGSVKTVLVLLQEAAAAAQAAQAAAVVPTGDGAMG